MAATDSSADSGSPVTDVSLAKEEVGTLVRRSLLLVIAMKAWMLARESERFVPRMLPAKWPAWWWVPLGASVLHTFLLVESVAIGRYQTSHYLLRPGVDVKRERTASMALQEGLDAANRSDFVAAERSLQEALTSWVQLTTPKDVPLDYRTQLGCTLNNLGWTRARQGQLAEAEQSYLRCLAIEERLAGGVTADAEFQRIMNYARKALADLHEGRSLESLDAKNQAARLKYEEAIVKSAEGMEDSRTLIKEAIELWEECLAQITKDDQRSAAYELLADANHRLAEVEEQCGDLQGVEAALEKVILYHEKVLASELDRPIHRHNLTAAREQLDALREQEVEKKIDRLMAAGRFAEVIETYRSGIRALEGQVDQSAEDDPVKTLLAVRLDRAAWTLADCPDERLRDTEEAVDYAQRATQLKPEIGKCWQILARVLYRDGDWQKSLSALDQMEAKTGEFDGADWYLSAMMREAEQNPAMRLRYELICASLESLRQEAEDVLNGKDVAIHGTPGAGRFGAETPVRRRPC